MSNYYITLYVVAWCFILLCPINGVPVINYLTHSLHLALIYLLIVMRIGLSFVYEVIILIQLKLINVELKWRLKRMHKLMDEYVALCVEEDSN